MNEILQERVLPGNDLQTQQQAWRFWQVVFIYFWFGSIAGHYFEVLGSQFYRLAFGHSWTPDVATVLPMAVPYGLGVVALILIVGPLMRRYKLHPIGVYVAATLVVSAVEFICAALVVLAYGHNPFWNYSSQPLNLYGFISFKNSLIFGTLAVFFIYVLYPLCQKVIERLSNRTLSVLFWVLFVGYVADQLFTYFL